MVESDSVDPGGRLGEPQPICACWAAIHANKKMRNDLNGWAPVCRTHPRAQALEAHARSMMNEMAVTVTNIHQAKGMEWDYGFLLGATDGVLPDFRAAAQGTMDSERSLPYVALTRPRKRLRLCRAPMFGRQSRRSFDQPSRFLVKAVMRPLMKRLRLT